MSRFSPRESEANAPFTQALVSCRAGVASVIRLDIYIFAFRCFPVHQCSSLRWLPSVAIVFWTI